jgi:hypothetical protein
MGKALRAERGQTWAWRKDGVDGGKEGVLALRASEREGLEERAGKLGISNVAG